MRRLATDERGASMVFTAVCLVFLIGFAGLAVDVGALYAERTELQKGAEAAALAVAEDCALGARPCDVPTATATSESYVDANAKDLAGAVDSLTLDLFAQEVTVIARTERSDGGSIFFPFFAQVVGFGGSTVRAQAIATWGMLGSLNTIPITVSSCDIYDAGTGELYTDEITVDFLNPEGETCDGHPGFDLDADGQPMPAGFGELEEDGSCGAVTEAYNYPTADMWAFQSDGQSFNVVRDCIVVGESYVIPVFVDHIRSNVDPCPDMRVADGVTASGDCYGIGGYAHFTVTGFRFPGRSDGSPGCSPPQSCITGFVTEYSTTGEMGESFDFGVVVVELIG